jgi:hypothetical protein
MEIPQEIKTGLDVVVKQYSDSPATTNGGRILRFFAKFVSVDTLLKLLVHKK